MSSSDFGLFPWEEDKVESAPGTSEAGDGAQADATANVAADGDPSADEPADVTVADEPGGARGATAPAAGEAATARQDRPASRTEPSSRRVARKEYYSISEVADLVGLPAHVLRYWESQFSVLNPSKNRSGNRVYQRKEIRLILLVKQLLHTEKYTVEGAKQRIEQLRRGGQLQQATAHALDEQMVSVLREELRTLSELLSPDVE